MHEPSLWAISESKRGATWYRSWLDPAARISYTMQIKTRNVLIV